MLFFPLKLKLCKIKKHIYLVVVMVLLVFLFVCVVCAFEIKKERNLNPTEFILQVRSYKYYGVAITTIKQTTI